MNYIRDISLFDNSCYNMIIEIPVGTDSKYELVDGKFDKIIEVRKVIGKYPFYYGCFPETYAGDKDPLDAILLSTKKHNILDIIQVQPIAVIKTIDNGEQDDKVICVAFNENNKNVKKLFKKALKFLNTYKGKNSNTIVDQTIYTIEDAIEIIRKANFTYKNKDLSKSIKVDF